MGVGQTPPQSDTVGYSQRADDTHPNGMHSCYSIFYRLFKKTNVFLLTHENVLLLPPATKLGQVISSQASVILFTGGSASVHAVIPPPPGPGRHPPPRAEHTWRYGQRAGGMHPTGIQSCCKCYVSKDKSSWPVRLLVVKMHTSHQKHQGLSSTKNNFIHKNLLVYSGTPLCSNFLGSVYTKRQRLSQRYSSDKNAIFLPHSLDQASTL